MKAVRLYSPGDLRVEEIPVPGISEDEVLVKVKAVGVCGSDIPRVNKYGTYKSPLTVGHEFGGEVEKVGNKVTNFSVGDRVSVAPLIPCFNCEWCKAGEYSLCEHYDYYGSRRDGAMAEYIAVHQNNLIKFSKEVSFDDIATLDPCANAAHGLIRGGFREGETLCVYGTGPIGLYVIQYAKIFGAKKVIAVDVFDEKLEIASKMGADVIINGKRDNPIQSILDATEGSGTDMVIDLTGVPFIQDSCILSAKKMGRIVFLGISHKPLDLSEKAVDSILRKQLSVIGSWNSFSHPFPGKEWTESVRFFEEGKLSSKYMISHRLSLDEAPEMFRRIAQGNLFFNKIMFYPWGI